MSFIEEIQTFNGPKFYCLLCGVHVDLQDKINHCKEKGHSTLQDYETCDTLSVDDKLIMVKSESLAPSEAEFVAVKNIVLTCEKTLKLVSDMFVRDLAIEAQKAESNDGISKQINESVVASASTVATTATDSQQQNIDMKTENEINVESLENIKKDDTEDMNVENDDDDRNGGDKNKENINTDGMGERQLLGSVRVGLLGNGLLMAGDVRVCLVVVSRDKPTFSTLVKMKEYFDEQLTKVTPSEDNESSYQTTLNRNGGCFVVAPVDPLAVPQECCDEALLAIRRARWFESKMYLLNHCEPVFRVLRDLCSNDPTLTVLNIWVMLQQLLFKVLSSSSGAQISISEAVLRFFENGPGLQDPCERVPINLCKQLTMQERENITFKSQEILRFISQKRLYEILNIPEENKNDKVKAVIKALEDIKMKKINSKL
ncbi:hypothetical protein HELRODRAFT_174804 [Helobdella robusta]|uniref:DZF domain-containing protein n=1 Tax=Helobdella robusta TaxID=6412 RepID=T1F8H9_HELRO|nr:hypothetical protein HELRODRAFT_174804 [Helobdella robusta]ESO01257.1 hypothetical protein HELRODRAFT_174804 [Helobdella robusta]